MKSRPLSKNEVILIENSCNIKTKCLFILALKTGFRISELLSLTVADVLTTKGEIVVTVVVKRKNMKGKHSSRSVPLHAEAGMLLKLYIGTLEQPLCANFKLFPFTRMTAHRMIKQCVESAGIESKGISSHSMRKTFGMNVYEKCGKDVVAAQRALGHKSLSSTTAYLSVNQDVIDKAILGD